MNTGEQFLLEDDLPIPQPGPYDDDGYSDRECAENGDDDPPPPPWPDTGPDGDDPDDDVAAQLIAPD